MKKQIRSFGFAFRGILTAICTEAHLRFHIVAAIYVIITAFICGFSAERLALLFVLVGLVISSELVNTAIEKVCDLITTDYHPIIRIAKDIAAGAVLAIAGGAAAVACVFFLNAEVIGRFFAFLTSNPLAFAALAASAVPAVLFVRKGPAGILYRISQRKNN